tara:strand:- start:877 stop:1287 length:411 start_codon:yes stop_codon:yes gene_type:complete
MNKPLNILLVEDDAIEVMKFQRVLLNLEYNHTVSQSANGEEAIVYLNETKNLPNIILLDLNMSRMNGLEFLEYLKTHEDFKCIPTVILTTSSNKKDVLECYRMGIAGYVLKPLKYEEYVSCIQCFFQYWMHNQLVH